MNRGFRWMGLVLGVITAVAVGVLSYNAGVAHGIAVSPALANAPAAGAVPYGWYHPWGFGFFPPLFFLLVWVVVFGMVVRGGRGGCYGRRRWAGYPGPEEFEEWHRRAHEGMTKQS